MKNLLFAFCFLNCIQFSSCTKNAYPQTVSESMVINDGYTSTTRHHKTGAGSSIEHPKTILDLDDYIRGLAGINISGAGTRATITVRGVSSFQSGSNEPLFVINGTPMSSYASAYMAINPVDIKRVTVLTDAASTGIYGSRGANGVIVITLKNTK